jgi:hypothetical protein
VKVVNDSLTFFASILFILPAKVGHHVVLNR